MDRNVHVLEGYNVEGTLPVGGSEKDGAEAEGDSWNAAVPEATSIEVDRPAYEDEDTWETEVVDHAPSLVVPILHSALEWADLGRSRTWVDKGTADGKAYRLR